MVDAGSKGLKFLPHLGKDYVSVDIRILTGASEDDGRGGPSAAGCCAVCTEPLEWVAVGRCGHAAVCPRCTIRMRHVNGDHSCCICRAVCPIVMVTRAGAAAAAAASGAKPMVSMFKEYWYHASTAAYFEDEQQYQAAREACTKKPSPYHRYYRPLRIFIPLFVAAILMGSVLGFGLSKETKHVAVKVVAYAMSILFCISLITFMWLGVKCQPDPDQE